MAIDILKMDKECKMPNFLRRQWREITGRDPLRVARILRGVERSFVVISFIGLALLLLSVIWLKNWISEHTIFSSIVLIVLGLIGLTLIVLNRELWDWGKANKFAAALEELAEELGLDPCDLHLFNYKQLKDWAAERICRQIEKGEWEQTQKRLLAFRLIEEDLKPYFAMVKVIEQEAAQAINKETTRENN